MKQNNISRNFYVIEGGLRAEARSASHKFITAQVTDTRLMGVCYVKAHWRIESSSGDTDLIQFFYFDWQEFGLDSYESLSGVLDSKMLGLAETIEQGMSGGLGGEKNPITERELRALVQEFAGFSKEHSIPLPEKSEEFEFLLSPAVELTKEEQHDLICKECVQITRPFEVINYFLMRCFARDFAGAKLLTKNYVRTDLFSGFAPADMLRNSIKEDTENTGASSGYYATGSDSDFGTFSTRKSYICQSLIEFNAKYYLVLTRVSLENLYVVKYERLWAFRISMWEASLILNQPEFVTVYDVMGDMHAFGVKSFPLLWNAMVSDHECGKLFTVYYPHNKHLQRPIYHMYDDLFGICYALESGQIVLGARSRENIEKLEQQLISSKHFNSLVLVGRYEFNHPIVGDFVDRCYEDFEDYLHDLGADD